MLRTIAVLLAAALAVGPAGASGGFWCEAEDAGAGISLRGGVTHGMGGAMFSFDGAVELSDSDLAPDLRSVAFTRDHVAQYWLDGVDLRLVLYREREDGAHGYVETTILAEADASPEAGAYRGAYRITAFDLAAPEARRMMDFVGEILCGVE